MLHQRDATDIWPYVLPVFLSCKRRHTRFDCDCSSYLYSGLLFVLFFFFFQAEDGIRDLTVTGVQTCALPIFPGGLTFVALSVDAQRACGVATGGSAYCWGWIPVQNQFTNAPTAVPGGLSFVAVSAGWFHSCGVTTSGAAYCWGGNANGELGDGSHTASLVPVKVAGRP